MDNLVSDFVSGCKLIKGTIKEEENNYKNSVICTIDKYNTKVVLNKSNKNVKLIDRISWDELNLKNASKIKLHKKQITLSLLNQKTNVGDKCMEISNNKGDSLMIANKVSELKLKSASPRVFLHDRAIIKLAR